LSMDAGLRACQPQVIWVGQEEFTPVLHQLLVLRRLFAPSAKLAFFTWNNIAVVRPDAKRRLMWSHVCSQTDLAIVGNNDGRAVLRGAGYKPPIVVQTEIGVDPAVFHPSPEGRERERHALELRGFVIGYFGRMRAIKGLADLAEALAGLPGDWTLLLAGGGPMLADLEARLSERPGRLRNVGMLPLDEVPTLMRACDVVVLPSQTHLPPAPEVHKEQFGLVLAQAMASGVPVVGTASGAIPEVVGDAGLVVPERDAMALRAALQRVRDEPGLADDLARRGLARARERFSVEALADQTFDILTQVTGRPTNA